MKQKIDKWVKVSKTTAREFAKSILGVNVEMEEESWGASRCYSFKSGIIKILIPKESFKTPQAMLFVNNKNTDNFHFVNNTLVIDDEADE